MKKILISAIFLTAFLSPNYTNAQKIHSSRLGTYQHTHTKFTELKHTKLKVNFDYEKEQMNGEEWLTASPYFYSSDSLVLNAKAMLIHEVALFSNGKNSPLKYEYKDNLLHINLDKTYNRNQEYTVYLKYTAKPNEVTQKGSAAISDAKGLYFINADGSDPDKPTQIWTQGETESSSAWFPTIDKPNQKTTQEIYMTVPQKYVTLSNGLLKNSTTNGNFRTDHWVMDQKHAPYLFFMGVGEYAVIKDKWQNIPVDYYVEKEYEPYAKEIFGNTPEMMDFFSKKLNYNYPWSKYAQIVGRDYVSGAMENTTATLHGESAYQKKGDLIDDNTWENVIAHELFHHWFGDLVTTESWSNLTVNESFANYSEYLWNEYKYGKDAADYHLSNDISGYKADPDNFSKDLVRFNFNTREDMFDAVTYNKGGAILHMLRNYLGDEAFFMGMTDYLKSNEYGTGEAHQLRLSMEKISGKDLSWFFNQWYYGSGHPKLQINYSFEPIKKQAIVTITQTQTQNFEFPLTLDIYENDKKKSKTIWVEAKPTNTFYIDYQTKPSLIHVNADGNLLADIEDSKTAEQYLYQYQYTKSFYGRNTAIQFAKNNPEDPISSKILFAALQDPFFRLRIEAVKGFDLSKASDAKLALTTIEKIASNDPKTLVQSAAVLALAKTKDKKYFPVFEKGMTSVSNAVKGSSLFGIANLSPEKVEQYINKLDLDNASEDLMTALLPIIVQNKIEKQMHTIGSTVAFYPFLKFQNPTLGAAAEDGFKWIMSSDNLKATRSVTKILKQVKPQISNNPQAKMMIIKILEDGLTEKMKVLKSNPQSENLNIQVTELNKALENYKN